MIIWIYIFLSFSFLFICTLVGCRNIYRVNKKSKSAWNIIFSLIPYIEAHLSNGGKSWDICKHLINLVEGIPKAKIWRNQITNKSIKNELNIEYLFKLTSSLEEMGY